MWNCDRMEFPGFVGLWYIGPMHFIELEGLNKESFHYLYGLPLRNHRNVITSAYNPYRYGTMKYVTHCTGSYPA